MNIAVTAAAIARMLNCHLDALLTCSIGELEEGADGWIGAVLLRTGVFGTGAIDEGVAIGVVVV